MLLHMPALAIIIPCYNEERRLSRESVTALLTGIGSAVIYFVNDGSTDNTQSLLGEIAATHPGRARVISLAQNGGKAKAIESAIHGGVRRVHVVSYKSPEGILGEVFTNEGTGTLIVADVNALSPAEQLTVTV